MDPLEQLKDLLARGFFMPSQREILDAVVKEMEKLRKALVDIRDHPFNSYDHQYCNHEAYRGPYGIGVVDGHRSAASIARQAVPRNEN